jgi:hypothetical protein
LKTAGSVRLQPDLSGFETGCRHVPAKSAALLAVAIAIVAFQVPGASQGLGRGEDQTVTYTRGQSVVPIFHGWMKNPDGTYDLYFSYINRNWQEELDIPIGPNNSVSPEPLGPDAGQPTHFYPRMNRWQFTVRVPADFGTKEIVWTLTSHGETHRAYGLLNPGYEVDEFLIMHEYGNSIRGRKRPVLKVEGDKQRTLKVGQASQLVAVATDPNPALPSRRGGDPNGALRAANSAELAPGPVGGDFVRSTARGLYLAWLVYRGSGKVTFTPPIPFKVWEDQRGGSPWSPGWQPPPIPPGNKWVYDVTFREPGTYVLRAQARDGFLFANEDVRFTVTP